MPNTPALTSPSSRFLFIDLLRGWAVFVMIETHVVNALLQVSLKEQPTFAVLTFMNGLVAPSFLFCAGFALAITLHRKWKAFVGITRTFWRYILRVLFILIVGYSLHVPFFSLRRMASLHDEAAWISFFQADILQTIAATLLMLIVLAVLVRKERLLFQLSALITLAIVFFAPILREMDHSTLPIWFRPYLTPQFKSQFPLFPWSAFLMSGTIGGYLFLRSIEEGKEKNLMHRIVRLAVIGIAISLIFEILPFSIYPNHDFWRASPEFFFVRLGLMLLCLVGLWLFEQRTTVSARSFIVLFGQESLLVYVVHLLIVYGHDYDWSFVRQFGPNLNYLECFGLFAVLTAAMFILAFGWHQMKSWNKRWASVLQYAVLIVITLQFLVRT